MLNAIYSARTRTSLEESTSSVEFDLTPPFDERPFFFNQLPLFEAGRLALNILLGGRPDFKGVVLAGNLYATMTLIFLFMISIVLVIAAIFVPLRPAIRDVGRQLAIGGTAYFFLIGAGFMLTEIALLQRLSVFLGHPIYSLSIVLFTMILATGLGSLISDKFALDTHAKLFSWALLTAGYLTSLILWMPNVLLSNDGSILIQRAIVCISIVAPAGLLMGFGFPTGMKLISAVDKRPTPWFWGINGAAGVMASSLAVACSIEFGIHTTLVLGALCYPLLIPAAWFIGIPEAPRLASS